MQKLVYIVLFYLLGSFSANSAAVPTIYSSASFEKERAHIESLIANNHFGAAGLKIDQIINDNNLTSEQLYQLVLHRFDTIIIPKAQDNLPKYRSLVRGLVNKVSPEKKAVLHLKFSQLLHNIGQYDNAVMQAEAGMRESNDRPSVTLADLYYFKGAAQARQDNLDEAIKNMLVATEMRKSLKLPPKIRHYIGLGAAYGYIGNLEQSQFYLFKALRTASSKHPEKHLLHLNIAANYMDLEQHKLAISHSKESIRMAEELGIINNLPLLNIGESYTKLKQFDKALEYIFLAQQKFLENNQTQWLPEVSTKLADAYLGLGQREKAAEYYREAYITYQEKDLRVHRIALYPKMIANLEALFSYQEALTMMKEFKALSDETRNLEAKKYQSELQSAFELQQKDAELEQMLKEKSLQAASLNAMAAQRKAEQKTSYYINIFLVVLTMLTMVLAALLYMRSQANQQLKDKNKAIFKLNGELKKQSNEDSLTGLFNRHFLSEFIKENTARQHLIIDTDADKTWSMILLDIDKFKRFNDNYGHDAGDKALIHFSNTLNKTKRDSDIVIRWGGEEFIWLCAEAEEQEAEYAYLRLQQALANSPVQLATEQVQITSSAGIQSFKTSGLSTVNWPTLLKAADRALYHSKDNGRNCATLTSRLFSAATNKVAQLNHYRD